MTAEPIPSPWAQPCPRSVRLDPGELLVPAATLRAHLGRRGRIDLVYAGDAFLPRLRNGARLTVAGADRPRPGALALCDASGWGDLRRLLVRDRAGRWITALDALPRCRELLPPERILGVVLYAGGRRATPLRPVSLFPIRSRWSAVSRWWDRIRNAPLFNRDAMATVRRKYSGQVEGYVAIPADRLDDRIETMLLSGLPAGASILVAGSGAGGEVVALARRGYRVTGFDFVPEMVSAARARAAGAGVGAEFVEGEMTTIDLGPVRFDAVYISPLVLSFVPGRGARIAALRNLGRRLRPGGRVLFSAEIARGAARRAELTLLHARRRRAGAEGEWGDWYTSFLLPSGTIGASFIHLASRRAVLRETRAAGFTEITSDGTAFFLAGGFRG